MSYHLENIFQNAKSKIIIITPYVKIHAKLKAILTDKAKSGVDIVFVCRKSDLKDDLSQISSVVVDNPKLHAKCYLTDQSALIGSLNLYDYSQINNDEMGILVENRGDGKYLYEQIFAESKRLCGNTPQGDVTRVLKTSIKNELPIGQKFSLQELDSFFDFDYKKMSGIKKAACGDLVLLSSSTSHYANRVVEGVIHFQGQKTGAGPQKLIFGNKDLFGCYKKKHVKIHLFTDFVYTGQVFISSEPYTENGVWFFPLSKQG
ncbi:MAG: phospholipase D family protein [Pseudodesulfovibrio sp.]|nr:phospholipase D family protein [Pseudodesulfovibrio sp.]